MKRQPKPLASLNPQKVQGLFFDIDDTLSTEGKITAEAYRALWDLKKAGKILVPITGRPAGWCDHIARMWPVNAVIGENGAFYFQLQNNKMKKFYTANPAERQKWRKKLVKIGETVLREVPGAGIASDQDYREFDLAIDFCEDVGPLSGKEIDKIVSIFEKEGARTKISSIHVNGWFGDYDKGTTVKIFVKNELKMDLERDNGHFVFCGDSPNDEPLFAFFQNSVGVANVLRFRDRMNALPKHITRLESGAGFVELVSRLLS